MSIFSIIICVPVVLIFPQMNAAQPPLQHGPGQPHDLQPHPPPMMQFQAQQMRGLIQPPAPGGPFPPGPQPLPYSQHRPVPPPNGMIMAQSMPRMMVPNGISPSAMVSTSIPFPSHSNPNAIRRQPMPPVYHQFPPNGPAPNYPLGHPMLRPAPGGELVPSQWLLNRTLRCEKDP